MATALFITRNDIIKQSVLGGAVDADALLPFVNTAQQKYILNLVGTVLYNKLSDDIIANTPFTGRYLELMNDYIKPTLIWYSCVEYIPFSSIEFKTKGAQKHQSETSIAPDKAPFLIGLLYIHTFNECRVLDYHDEFSKNTANNFYQKSFR